MFLNGVLRKGDTFPLLNFGTVKDAGVNLSGDTKLTFMAKRKKGGEIVEFFTAGMGGNYPDSSQKRSTGFITLSKDWKQY